MENTKVLAINSFAVHGMASLKTMISILGSRVLPVPSVLLNGLTNLPLVQKFEVPFEELLNKSFELIKYKKQSVIVTLGYLGAPSHAAIILDALERYKEHIRLVIADPISGDHGRTYVSADIVAHWPSLLERARFAFPNETELKLITGFPADHEGELTTYLQEFEKRYPYTTLIATSISGELSNKISICYKHNGEATVFSHKKHDINLGGTGDAFLSYFILFHFYFAKPVQQSIQEAALKVQSLIASSILSQSDELIISEQFLHTDNTLASF